MRQQAFGFQPRQPLRYALAVSLALAACGLAGSAGAQQLAQTTVTIPSLGSGSAPQQHEAAQRRTVEVDGTGQTEAAARASAVSNALEEVVGVYLQSSRRTELHQEGSEVREAFQEKILAQSNGFVERVTTLRFWQENGEAKVRIRAEVVVNRLLEVMRDARMPLIPIDQASMTANLRTQLARDENGRELVAQYLADLIRNVDIRLDGLKFEPLPSDPDMVRITSQAAFRVKPDYVERGQRMMRDVAQDIQVGYQMPDALMLCIPANQANEFDFGPYGAGMRGMTCRGFEISKQIAERLSVESPDWLLIGLGLYRLIGQRMTGQMNGIELSPGPFLVLEVLDATGGSTVRVSTKLFTQCDRAFSTMIGYDQDSFLRGYYPMKKSQGHSTTVQVFPLLLGGQGMRNPIPVPATCTFNNARILGNPRAPEVQRTLLGIVPRASMEQAANLRVSLSWEP